MRIASAVLTTMGSTFVQVGCLVWGGFLGRFPRFPSRCAAGFFAITNHLFGFSGGQLFLDW
jgi:hypothetical protein